jgi:hypothetical protein
MVFSLDQVFVSQLTNAIERIPVPLLGEHQPSAKSLTDNEHSSLRKLLDRSTNVSSNGHAANDSFDALRRGLNDLLDPDELSEL